jgi:hypothetical protein
MFPRDPEKWPAIFSCKVGGIDVGYRPPQFDPMPQKRAHDFEYSGVYRLIRLIVN